MYMHILNIICSKNAYYARRMEFEKIGKMIIAKNTNGDMKSKKAIQVRKVNTRLKPRTALWQQQQLTPDNETKLWIFPPTFNYLFSINC